jgi:hypothetical protein
MALNFPQYAGDNLSYSGSVNLEFFFWSQRRRGTWTRLQVLRVNSVGTYMAETPRRYIHLELPSQRGSSEFKTP